MDYGLKYELLCTSKKDGNAYSLQLLFDGHTDPDIDRNIPASSPMILRKDKSSVIRGTSLEFSIREESDWEFDEFYTNNAKKIKAELYQNSALIWTGYILPQQYQAPYISCPLNVQFTASDGLGLLKNESFTLIGNNSQLAIIMHCINKIGITLDYSIAINIFESSHDTSRSPLEQTYEDALIYAGKNCYEVLEAILGKYNAEITQSGGLWYITSVADRESARMIYLSTGEYDGADSSPSVLSLGYPESGDVYPVGSLSRSLEPGAKKVTLNNDFGRKKSLLFNYDFTQYDGINFTAWNKVGVGSFTVSPLISEGKPCCFISGYSAMLAQRLAQQIAITNVPGDAFVFEIDFAPTGNSQSGGSFSSISMKVRMTVILDVDNTSYYLTKTGWSLTPGYIEETVTAGAVSPIWNHLKIITDGLPGSGYLDVSLYRYYVGMPARPGDFYHGIWYSEPMVYFLSNGQLYPSGIKTTALFDNSTEPGDLGEIIITAADAPDLPNKSLLYKNITRLADGTPTLNWVRLGETAEHSFIVQLARMLASNNRIARQKLTGTVRGNNINPGSVIIHAYNDNRKFEIAEMSWDLYNDTFDLTLLEMLEWNSEAITFTVETTINAGSSSATGGAIIGTIGGNDAGQSILNLAFQTPLFADPLDLDAVTFKNFKPGIITGNTVINVLNASDGDVGMIELIIDDTGGYTVIMGLMFTKRIGLAEINTADGSDNFIVWRKILDDYVYEVLGANSLIAEGILAVTEMTFSGEGPNATLGNVFDTNYIIENSGEVAGSGIVDWKIALDAVIVSEGSFRSALVDPLTPLEDIINLIAPEETGEYVLWMKMRADEEWTIWIAFSVGYQFYISSVSVIGSGANGGYLEANISLSNAGPEGNYTVNWQIIQNGTTIVSSGNSNFYHDGSPGNFMIYPENILYPSIEGDLTLSVTIEKSDGIPVISNEFVSITVTINHIDAIPIQYEGDAFDINYEATAAYACWFYPYWRLRNAMHQIISSGYDVRYLSQGTYTYSLSGSIPAASHGINNDIQIGRRSGAFEVTSNHFEIQEIS